MCFAACVEVRRYCSGMERTVKVGEDCALNRQREGKVERVDE